MRITGRPASIMTPLLLGCILAMGCGSKKGGGDADADVEMDPVDDLDATTDPDATMDPDMPADPVEEDAPADTEPGDLFPDAEPDGEDVLPDPLPDPADATPDGEDAAPDADDPVDDDAADDAWGDVLPDVPADGFSSTECVATAGGSCVAHGTCLVCPSSMEPSWGRRGCGTGRWCCVPAGTIDTPCTSSYGVCIPSGGSYSCAPGWAFSPSISCGGGGYNCCLPCTP